ncbi:MAG: HAD family hydrolase [Bacteroidetes bacterium]|nr:HAD family hydrolase [Bacteroidota bacterium]
MSLKNWHIDPTWTLFLDRDGVINRRLEGDYVKRWDDFEFLPGVKEAIALLSKHFRYIFIVSNQQGIGKGIMTHDDLGIIHEKMVQEITEAGGRVDHIYYSPYLESEDHFMRKPNVGMALRARKNHPGLIFKKSFMVGDSLTDMIFGKRVGMKTVMIEDNPNLPRKYPKLMDFSCNSLVAFAAIIHN